MTITGPRICMPVEQLKICRRGTGMTHWHVLMACIATQMDGLVKQIFPNQADKAIEGAVLVGDFRNAISVMEGGQPYESV